MTQNLSCPSCGSREIDLRAYDSMMVLRSDLALFGVHCNRCGTKISTLQPIPPSLRDEVRFAAAQVGAGMGME